MKYFSIFAISILLHFLIWFFADKWPSSQNDTPAVVELIIEDEKRPESTKQIVRETHQKPKEKPKYDFKPRFFSDTTKYTEQETRAAQSGLTQNRSQNPRKSKVESQRQNQEKMGPGSRANKESPQAQSREELATPGVSRVGESLPDDIKVGQWTSLNTERYLFYTFFARIEERVRFHWERAVRETADTLPRPSLISKDWLTEIEIVLDRRGYFEKAIIHRRSGIEGFDAAATNAFRVGSPFLNPPQELVQKDGKLHLKYSITVSFAPFR